MTVQLQPGRDYKLKFISNNGKNVKRQVSDNAITIKNVQENGTLSVTFAKSGSIVNPATGDNSNILLWSILAFGSAVTLFGIAFKTKKTKHSQVRFIMRKIISTILAVTLLMCMSVTAFAGEQTVTVTIPDRDFTMSIPAKTEISYGSTDVRAFNNELTIRSTNPTLLFSNSHYVQVDVTYGDLVHRDNNKYMLPLSILYAKPADETNVQGGYGEAYTWENLASGGCVTFNGTDFYWANGYRLGAKVTGWDSVEPGEYQATLTYTATIKQK